MAEFLRLEGELTYWFVEDGRRWGIVDLEEARALGDVPLRAATPEELDAIPIANLQDEQAGDVEEDGECSSTLEITELSS